MNKYFPLVFITIFEALIGIWIKFIGTSIPIMTVNFYRVFFAFLSVLIIVPFFDKKFLRLNKWDIKPVIIIGFLITLQICFFNLAFLNAPIANVVILYSTYPFFVFFLSSLFLKEEVKKIHILIFLVGFAGVVITKPFAGTDFRVLGNSLALFGAIAFAFLVAYMRKQNKTHSPGFIFWSLLISSIFLLPMPFIFGTGNIFASYPTTIFNSIITIPVIFWLLGLGIISTGFCYILMGFALKRIKANIYSLVDIIVSPLIAAIFAYLILGEIPSKNMVLGGIILILAAVWLATYLSRGNISGLDIYSDYFSPVRQEFSKSENWPTKFTDSMNSIRRYFNR